MQIIRTVQEFRDWRRTAGRLALVPTMGNLHDGHLALVAEARKRAESVAVSIFVNPLQFGQGEDFGRYPRTFDEDVEKLDAAGADVVFAPSVEELYPNGAQQYHVEPPAIQDELCGQSRPGHFRGVATVVCKLFNIATPDAACFGKKDYQQLVVIRDMTADLNMAVEIVPVDTGRATDGLALSSRNGYLDNDERGTAPQLHAVLQETAAAAAVEKNGFTALAAAAVAKLDASGWRTDYVEIRRAGTLAPAEPGDTNLVVLAAAYLGKTRLIDNIEIGTDSV